MRLQEWIQQYHGTEILRFDHLCEYLDATPFEIKHHLDGISTEITGVLKSEEGVGDDAFITKLEHHLLNRFDKLITATSFYRLCHFIYHQMPCSVPLSDICRPSCDSKSVGQGIAAL